MKYLILFLFIPILIAAQDKQKQFTIDECVSQFNWEDTVGTKVGYQFWFVDKNFLDGRTLKMSVVAPHKATHAPHTHAEDEFFFVLEGTAEFYLDGETRIGKPYSSFYCPPNSMHGIRNAGDTELKYLVIKKYNMK
ncbi:cupin domain-containing protein [Melioribacter sp. Ez-97]|uniref:cupin domain-containing protein n=1 Tax=Melioribacter sp. Ez-97 TaxID=3423434 RepID=UPI003ED9854D